MAKEKVNYQEVHGLYQLCSQIKDFASSVRIME